MPITDIDAATQTHTQHHNKLLSISISTFSISFSRSSAATASTLIATYFAWKSQINGITNHLWSPRTPIAANYQPIFNQYNLCCIRNGAREICMCSVRYGDATIKESQFAQRKLTLKSSQIWSAMAQTVCANRSKK